ncbi:MAG: cytochrome c peroxidase [Crocinitomicaceae bacterium]|jgi:cytochrome c peroxidase
MYSIKNVKVQRTASIQTPKGWPEPHYNPAKSNSKFELGKKLFYDPKLSRDESVSCANCHLSYTAFTHVDHAVSHGIEGKKGTRNSPVLINLAWNNSFHWDGGVNHLEMQMINPIQHPAEMDNTLENVIAYLNSNQEYRKLFYAAYSDSVVNSKSMLQAFAYFTSQLISSNSKYDQYKNKELKLSKQEKNGMKLFKKNCNSCHTAPLFNSNVFASNGLPIDTNYNDVGRYAISKIGSDSLKFRVPTLRNIEHSYPYMHDGRFKKLRDVIDHYTNQIDLNDPYLSGELRKKIVLSDDEKKDLIAFLKTLTDREFLYNKRFRPSR